jgi:hypothetical protein
LNAAGEDWDEQNMSVDFDRVLREPGIVADAVGVRPRS